MAAVTASNVQVVFERGNDDARGASIGNLLRATVYFDNGGVGGTAVVGGVDTLDCNLATAIQGMHQGGTVTVRTFAMSQAATTTTNAGVETTRAGFVTLSTNTISVTPKTDGYLTGSTNGTLAAAQVVRPYGVYVVYTLA